MKPHRSIKTYRAKKRWIKDRRFSSQLELSDCFDTVSISPFLYADTQTSEQQSSIQLKLYWRESSRRDCRDSLTLLNNCSQSLTITRRACKSLQSRPSPSSCCHRLQMAERERERRRQPVMKCNATLGCSHLGCDFLNLAVQMKRCGGFRRKVQVYFLHQLQVSLQLWNDLQS